MNDFNRLKAELHEIAQRANREVRIFRTSYDLLSPAAVYAVENLATITQDLKQQLAVIAEHQSAAARNERETLEI